MLHPQRTINCKGHLIDLTTPAVMGILNITPDSFYDGGRYTEGTKMLLQVEKMLEEGADIIDIGGMSSRPGADVITAEEELRRVLPVIRQISERFPKALLSIDTIHSKVARESIQAGAHLINDISAGRFDSDMYSMVAELQVPYVLMHMKGDPKNMQKEAHYQDMIQEILDFFIEEVGKLRSLGVKDIILDPGFGFGKTITHNFQLLKQLHIFGILGLPILSGLSRKSMIYKTLGGTAGDALNGTTALNMVALQQGSSILRVHDVKAAKETIHLWQRLQNS